MNVLVVNTGSSSLKLTLLDPANKILAESHVERWEGQDTGPLRDFVAELDHRIDAVGHRVVHGGTEPDPAVVDDRVRARIEELTELAPLHQPRALAGLDATAAVLPQVPAVACFDNAFHATLPDAAATYALPAEWRRKWGLRRYGFHGLSHAYAARRAAHLLNRPIEHLCTVTCHLGAGASLCAVHNGQSVDTTMGFTPLEGLIMATRSGTVDPGLLIWLLQNKKLSVDELADTLEHHSGLAGLAGGSGDLRDIHRAAESGDPNATLALDVYIHRLRREIAAMAATMNGLDALVFTGGIGEHDPTIRARTAAGLTFLGIHIDPDRNTTHTPDTDISPDHTPVRTLVITAREDIEIADATRTVLRCAGSSV